MSKLDDIPANSRQTMTRELVRLFRAAHCDPACHSCQRKIKPGRKFQLAEIDGRDEMLCGRCTAAGLRRKRARAERLQAKRDAWAREAANRKAAEWRRSNFSRPYGGYSRPSRAKA